MLAALHIITLGSHHVEPHIPVIVGESTRDFKGQNGINMSNWHKKLRDDLLQGYDLNSPPISNRAQYSNETGLKYSLGAVGSDAGTDIMLQLRVLKLDSIDISEGHLSVKVWLRMQWQDQRLAWNKADYGGLGTVRFWARDSDDTEIWVPDITTYNTRTSLVNQVAGAWVEVYSDGSTFYSRAGHLDILCKFQGLVSFPFDKDVRCDLDIGGWMTGGAAQGIFLKPGKVPGVDFLSVMESWDESAASSYEVAAERTTGSTYVQYALTSVTASASAIVYGCCPNDPYPVMTYTFHMFRTTQMMTILLLPLGFLTILANFAFFMKPDETNRVVYTMSILLIVMIVKDMTYSMVPLTGELLWIHAYIVFCEFFVKAITLQSIFVLVLSKYNRAFLFPSVLMIYIFFTTKRFRSAIDYILSADKEELLPTTGPQDSPQVGGSKSGSQVVPLENTDEFYQKKEMRETDLLEDDMMHHSKPLLDAEKNLVECEEKEAPPEVMRLLTWEKIFYQIDDKLRGYLFIEEATAFFTFIRLDKSQKAIKKVLDDINENQKNPDSVIILSEFIQASEALLGKVTGTLVASGIENFLSCREMLQTRHNRRWRLLAERIDAFFRIWGPIFYICGIISLFNVSMDDGYGPDANGVVKSRVIFTGLPPDISIEDGFAGVLRIICVPVIILIVVPIFFCARQLLLVSLTKNRAAHLINKSFGLKPNYSWVTPDRWWSFLFSTAHQEHKNQDGTPLKQDGKRWGPRYTSADLDRLIGYKIAPDARTRKVDTHKVSEDETVKDKTRRGWTRATVTGKDEGGDSSNSTTSDLETNP